MCRLPAALNLITNVSRDGRVSCARSSFYELFQTEQRQQVHPKVFNTRQTYECMHEVPRGARAKPDRQEIKAFWDESRAISLIFINETKN